jgi:hypothetical protein
VAAAVAVAGVALVVDYERNQGPGSIYACSGADCNGRDPQKAGCGVTPQTLLDQSVPDGTDVQIRYSPGCHAVWARIWNSQVGDSVTLHVPHGPNQSSDAADAMTRLQFVYTPLDGLPGSGSEITACVSSDQPNGAKCFTTSAP